MRFRAATTPLLAAGLALLLGACGTPAPDRTDAGKTFAYRGGEVALAQQGEDCRLTLRGEINPTTVSALRLASDALTGRSCRKTTLMLNAPDGQIGAAITLGAMLRNRHVDTHIPAGAQCQTACLLVFAAGTQRELAKGKPEPQLGFSQIPPDEDFGQGSCETELSNRQLLNLARYLKAMVPRMTADFMLDEIRATTCRGVRELPIHKAFSSGLVTKG